MADFEKHMTGGRQTHRFLSVRPFAVTVWLAWLGTIVIASAIHWSGVPHPWFVPIVLPVALQLAAMTVLVPFAVWQLFRGPDRLHAGAWLLLGSVPVQLTVALGMFVVWLADGRSLGPLLFPLHGPFDVMAVSLGDAELRWQYPYQYQGRHAIMWSSEPVESRAQLDAIDRHLDQMGKVLGKKCRARVHWVRGALLGHNGMYCRGVALGSEPSTAPEDPNDVPYVDLHETAHFAIHHHCEVTAEPPALLVEGWAEAQSRYKPAELALRAWRLKQDDAVLSLQELVSDDWYFRAFSPVYDQGGPLVDYLLRTYGGGRFFELYSTCRRTTFADDCRRILGITLDDLNRDYWNDIERQAKSPEAEPLNQPLRRAKLAPAVDRSLYERIAARHWAAYELARSHYRQARLAVDESQTYRDASGALAMRPIRHADFARDWPRHRSVIRDLLPGGESIRVEVVAPERSFRLKRSPRAARWTTAEQGPTGVSKYDWILWHNAWTTPRDLLAYSYLTDRGWSRLTDGLDCTITSLEPVEDAGRKLWKFEFISEKPPDDYARPLPRRGSFLLAPDKNWTVQSFEIHGSVEEDGPWQERESRHYAQSAADFSCPEDIRFERSDRNGAIFARNTRISDVRLEPTPLEEFTPQAFGMHLDELTNPAQIPWPVTACGAACLVSLLAGAIFLWIDRLQRSTRPQREIWGNADAKHRFCVLRSARLRRIHNRRSKGSKG